MLVKTRAGDLIQSPYLGIANRAAALRLKAASELGFTPTSRPRLAGEPGRAILVHMINASTTPRLRNPPIVEAVFDVDCDLPPGFELAALKEPSRAQFTDQYPTSRTQFIQGIKIETKPDATSSISSPRAIQAFQFLQSDEKQLVQVRAQGFSFNRLAPYSSLDDYLPEIERTWRLYVDLISPVQLRMIRLRYINRILLPMAADKVDLDEFLKIGPRSPDEENLGLISFLSQQQAFEKETGHQVNLVLANQALANEKLPVILDIMVTSAVAAEPTDWSKMRSIIESLRGLKNRVFLNTLTPKCIQLFQ